MAHNLNKTDIFLVKNVCFIINQTFLQMLISSCLTQSGQRSLRPAWVLGGTLVVLVAAGWPRPSPSAVVVVGVPAISRAVAAGHRASPALPCSEAPPPSTCCTALDVLLRWAWSASPSLLSSFVVPKVLLPRPAAEPFALHRRRVLRSGSGGSSLLHRRHMVYRTDGWAPNCWWRVYPEWTNTTTVTDEHTNQVGNVLSLFNVSHQCLLQGYL